jgi:hypothetical protein
MIRRRIPLTPNAARCQDTRQVPCVRASECARAVEPHAIGRQVNDFSTEPRLIGVGCGWFVAIVYADDVKPAPKVHEAPGWLR